MIMASANSNGGVIITRRHFWKNIFGLVLFAALFAYCIYKLATSNEPAVLLLAGIGAFSLLLTCIRVIRRLFLIRRVIAAGGVWHG
jgi:hypothetical protein